VPYSSKLFLAAQSLIHDLCGQTIRYGIHGATHPFFTDEVFDAYAGAIHHVGHASWSDTVETSTSDLVLCCHSDEPNHLILDWRNVLSRIPDNGSALIIGLVRIQLPAITTLSIAGQQPWFRNCLNQPVLVVERPYAFGIWCGYLQCA
jgi:hypothetical protein